MSRGDWYEPKDQIDHSHGKRVAGGTRGNHTQRGISQLENASVGKRFCSS